MSVEPPRKFQPIRFLAAAVTIAFIVIMSGGQFPTALFPLYAKALELDPIHLSLAYCLFLVALAAALIVSARPSIHRHAAKVLMLALVVTLCADLLNGSATLVGFLVGRALNGLAVGFAGGAAATLAVSAQGAGARTSVATATVMGGLGGTVLTLALAEMFRDPLHLNFVVHGAIVVAALATLAVALRASRIRQTYTAEHAASERRYGYRASTGFMLGVIAWGCGTLVVVLVPNGAMRTIPGVGLVGATLGTIVMLLAACIGQYGLARLRPRNALHFSYLTLTVGMVVLAVGMCVPSIALVLVGCAVIGAGEGLGYRTGLFVVSSGLQPARHGARTSAYACIAYGVSAALVFGGGWIVSGAGYGVGTLIIALMLVPVSAMQMAIVERDSRGGAEASPVDPLPL